MKTCELPGNKEGSAKRSAAEYREDPVAGPTAFTWSFPVVLMYGVAFALTFFLFENQMHWTGQGPYPSDNPEHVAVAERIAAGTLFPPHPLYHLLLLAIAGLSGVALQFVAPTVLATCVCATMGLARKVLADTSATRGMSVTMSVAAVLVCAIYFPPFSSNFYAGQCSPNPWHNPTYLLMKPAAIIAFYAALSCCFAARPSIGTAVLAALSLAASVLTKPNFALVFLPALMIVVVLFSRNRLRGILRVCMIALPTIAVLAWQYLLTFTDSQRSGLPSGGLQFGWLTIWRQYSTNVPVSILLAGMFPLLVTISRLPRHMSPGLVCAGLCWLFGLCQYAFLIETGTRAADGNFGWSYMIGLFFFHLESLKEYGIWSVEGSPGRMWKFIFNLVTVVLVMHCISGGAYLFTLLLGRTYM